ncbi:putative phosphatidylinositol kinase, partial [Klebsormidium nitens]
GFSSGQAVVGNLGAAFRGYSDAVSILDGKKGSFAALSSGDNGTAEREARRQSKASLKFARFCNDVLQLATGEADQTQTNSTALPPEMTSALAGGTDSGLPPVSQYPPLVVKHVLRALSLDASLKPHQLVPRVLALVGQNKETLAEFESGVESVPSWVFISWVSQILSVMEQPEGRVLARVLERVAEEFPQALYYPFNVSQPAFGDVARERTSRVARLLHNPLLDQFVTALSDLSHPNLKLKDWLSEISMRLQRRDNQGAQEAFREMYRDCLDARALAAAERQAGDDLIAYARNFESKIVSALGKDGVKLARMSATEYKNAISSVSHVLDREDLAHGKMQLSRFSKWLADYDQSRGAAPPRGARGKLPRGTISDFTESDAGGIEVPGQYGGFCRPDPGSHVTIVGFDQTLTCFSSIRRPKVLIIRGSDEKEYRFVVKGGEDLRLDQRIEQLFEVMNNALRVDPMCARRRLGVRTYGAIPVSSRCGLLEFVSPTRTIHDVIASGLAASLNLQTPDGAKTLLSDVQKGWQQWLTSHTGAVSSLQEAYQKSYTSLSRQSFEAQLGVAGGKLPSDALRAGIAQQAPGAESFLALRGQFARSLAALSICGYVAGVGDRHLQNFLLDVADGTLVPIDFGYSFGTATQMLPVPELVPFRLTRQFAQLLRPLDTLDLLKIDMTRVMTVLQENKDVLVAVMDVFVKEPLVDWRNESLKRRAALGAKGRKGAVAALRDGDEDEQMEVLEQEHVSLKIENAARKLARWNPAEVTLAELQQSMVNGKPFFRSLEGIVRGDPRVNARAKVDGKICATVQQQVECLIDQATDPNLVGRMWIGWAPWV